MIDIDNPPLVMACIILVVFVCPFIYSLFIDNYDKDKKGISTYGR